MGTYQAQMYALEKRAFLNLCQRAYNRSYAQWRDLNDECDGELGYMLHAEREAFLNTHGTDAVWEIMPLEDWVKLIRKFPEGYAHVPVDLKWNCDFLAAACMANRSRWFEKH